VKRPVDRIVEKLGMPQLIDALAVRLSGADLTSLLLEVTRRRAAVVTPADLMKRYATDRFVAATTASFSALRRAEDAVLSACADRYEAIALAPLVPLGTHSAIATVDQNKVLTTIRNNEVAADPTNALALEAATRRTVALRADPKSTDVVRLAASQRVVRTQHVSGPRRFAHFQLFGLVSAARDQGGRAFEALAASEHLAIHARALLGLGATEVTVALTDFSRGRSKSIVDSVRDALVGFDAVTCVDAPERTSGRGYYRDFCFKLHAAFGGVALETSDGGVVDWTQRLVGSAKERCFISGMGLDRVALELPGDAR
jgi:hypothetical protein